MRSDLGGTETNNFRAVQGTEVLSTLFLTEGEISWFKLFRKKLPSKAWQK